MFSKIQRSSNRNSRFRVKFSRGVPILKLDFDDSKRTDSKFEILENPKNAIQGGYDLKSQIQDFESKKNKISILKFSFKNCSNLIQNRLKIIDFDRFL